MIRDPVAEFGALIEEVKFASDSPLEGGGFELSVPRRENNFLWDAPVSITRNSLSPPKTGSSHIRRVVEQGFR